MKESLLHYIWRFQKFSKSELRTTKGQAIQVLNPGVLNDFGGPDFLEAKIYLDDLCWTGPVEVHLHSSDWFRHGHQLDAAYDNVILHVVWDFDLDVCYPSGHSIPTLNLSRYVNAKTLNHYQNTFLLQPKFISCEQEVFQFSPALWMSYQDRLFVERMEQRVSEVQHLLKQLNNDWEAVFFVFFAKGFGLNVNGPAFYEMAMHTPFKRILQLREDPIQLEALFLGQLGLLDPPFRGSYQEELFTQYSYFKTKYKLIRPLALKINFARLRPANFPTIRMAQLAQIYSKNGALFDAVVKQTSPIQCYSLFSTTASQYWTTHYNFDVESKPKPKKISRDFFDLLLINTLIPLRFAYAKYTGSSGETSLFDWAEAVPSEKNSILNKFKKLKIPQVNAVASQSLLHLYKNYCIQKKCLSCNVGFNLMKSSGEPTNN